MLGQISKTHALVPLLQWAFSAVSALAMGPSKAAISKLAVSLQCSQAEAQPLAQQSNRLPGHSDNHLGFCEKSKSIP